MGESASFIARLARISDNSSRSLWAASRRIAFLQAIHTIVSKTARTLPGLGEGTDGVMPRFRPRLLNVGYTHASPPGWARQRGHVTPGSPVHFAFACLHARQAPTCGRSRAESVHAASSRVRSGGRAPSASPSPAGSVGYRCRLEVDRSAVSYSGRADSLASVDERLDLGLGAVEQLERRGRDCLRWATIKVLVQLRERRSRGVRHLGWGRGESKMRVRTVFAGGRAPETKASERPGGSLR